jgi:hypothetical protein
LPDFATSLDTVAGGLVVASSRGMLICNNRDAARGRKEQL